MSETFVSVWQMEVETFGHGECTGFQFGLKTVTTWGVDVAIPPASNH